MGGCDESHALCFRYPGADKQTWKRCRFHTAGLVLSAALECGTGVARRWAATSSARGGEFHPVLRFWGGRGFVFEKCLTDHGSYRQIHRKSSPKKVLLIDEPCLVGRRCKAAAELVRVVCLAVWNFLFSSQHGAVSVSVYKIHGKVNIYPKASSKGSFLI